MSARAYVHLAVTFNASMYRRARTHRLATVEARWIILANHSVPNSCVHACTQNQPGHHHETHINKTRALFTVFRQRSWDLCKLDSDIYLNKNNPSMDFCNLLFSLLIIFATNCKGNMPDSIVMNVREGTPIDYKIGTLTSTSSSPQLPTYMSASDDETLFRITADGGVYVAEFIDLEALCYEIQSCCNHSQPCELASTVMVDDGTGGVGTLHLRVRILDENDNVPRFRQVDGQTVFISEKAQVGFSIDIEPAIDLDWSLDNQINRYSLHGDKLKQQFEVDMSEFRKVRLKLRKPLDYEKETEYRGRLEACDRDNCTSATLTVKVIDANDNLPVFESPLEYFLNVSEDFPVNELIIKLNATDPDSPANAQMRFEMVPSQDTNVPATFRLHEDTGAITLSRKLNAHARQTYKFQIRVRESMETAVNSEFQHPAFFENQSDTVEVTVHVKDINNFAPEITFMDSPGGSEIRIPENSPAGRILVMRVSDRDLGENGRVECNLDDQIAAQPSFKLNRSSDKIFLLYTRRSFDAEAEPMMMVNLTCWDSGSPRQTTQRQIVIHVQDINEHTPLFTKQEYTAQVSENSAPDEHVIQVSLTLPIYTFYCL